MKPLNLTLLALMLGIATVPRIGAAQAAPVPAVDPSAPPLVVVPDDDRVAGSAPAAAAAAAAAPAATPQAQAAATKPKIQYLPGGSGVRYKELKHGKGIRPDIDDMVQLVYVARIEHGQIFDSSGGAPKAVRVRTLIPGWADAVKSMTVGSRWVVWIPANRAFVGNTPLRGKAVKIDMRLVRILR